MNYYPYAKEKYLEYGIDTNAALDKLSNVEISMHCWQGDDVRGFEGTGTLDGGIQTTGNYPGAARTPDELMSDIRTALSLVGGKHRLNLHASYAIFEDGDAVDRDAIEPRHFKKWVEFAKENGIKAIDFNPTFFSHSKMKDGLTLSSPDKQIRDFWVAHGIACIRISEYFAREFGKKCLMNIWIPDGYKDIPADRYSPRARFAESLDRILACGYDRELVDISIESKVFGIGLESYTVGSAEFCTSYAANNGLVPLMDNGHYHPTELVSDKIPTMLLFNDRIALHITRSVRWDSDHVVILDDETKEMAREIVRSGALDRTYIALDYFDASINRVAAWVIGLRNARKALLYAMLCPDGELARMQKEGRFTEKLMLSEEIKTLPFGEVWDEFCRRSGVASDKAWFDDLKKYENEVLSKR